MPPIHGKTDKNVSGESAQLAVVQADDDLALVHASQAGDVAAFEELVRRYDRKIFRIAQHVVNNREDAEDVVQMTFLKAFQHVTEFREDAKFSTWLIRIAMNQSLMVLRKRRTAKVFNESSLTSEEEHIPMEAADWAPNPEQLYETSELREILRKTLATLSPGLRAVFILRDIEGFSLQETAEALGLSLSAVKARSLRARLRLRNRLSRYFKQASEMPQVEPDAGNRAGEEFY